MYLKSHSVLPTIRSILLVCVCVRACVCEIINQLRVKGGARTCNSGHTPLSRCKRGPVCGLMNRLLLARGPLILTYCRL